MEGKQPTSEPYSPTSPITIPNSPSAPVATTQERPVVEEESDEEYGQEVTKHGFLRCSERFWSNLSVEGRYNAFVAVIDRIYKAELEDGGTYRHTLYDVFGFGRDAYGDSSFKYMEIHNILNEYRHTNPEVVKREVQRHKIEYANFLRNWCKEDGPCDNCRVKRSREREEKSDMGFQPYLREPKRAVEDTEEEERPNKKKKKDLD